MRDLVWDIVVEGPSYRLAIGRFYKEGSDTSSALCLLPKVLYVDVGKGVSSHTLTYLITFISSFSFYHIDPGGFARKLRSPGIAGFAQSLLALSYSIATSYRFLLASRATPTEEHTRPRDLSWFHRRLKTLILPLAERPSAPIIDYLVVDKDVDDSELGGATLALGIASFLTAPTRHGGELRQAIAQTLLAIASKVESLRELSIRLLSALILDTYTWYSHHVKAAIDTYPAELRRLALSIPSLELKGSVGEIHNELCEKLLGVINRHSTLCNTVIKSVNVVREVLSKYSTEPMNREYLLGRLAIMVRCFEGLKGDEVATVATGQWNIAYPLLLKEMLGAEKVYVLYTQNVLEQRLIEEEIRRALETINELKSSLPKVDYVLTSATDAILVEEHVKYIVNKLSNKSIVIAQGPATLAAPLYLEACRARSRGINAKVC